MWSGGIVPLILKLDTRWQTSRPVHFTPDTQCIDSWFGPQRRSVRFGKEKNFLDLPGLEPRIVQPVTKSLYCLCFPDPED